MSNPLNPYAPPQALEGPHQLPGAPPIAYRTYQSAKAKTKAVVVTSVILVLLQLALAASFAMQLAMLYAARGGSGLDPTVANANDIRQQVLTAVLVLGVLACLIALLVWVHGTHANLPALGAERLDFTPGWAVGWFFIPIANLVKPYQAVSEIWHRSQPNPLLGQPTVGAQLVGWWWGLRIISAIVERVLGAVSNSASTIDDFVLISWVAIILTLLLDTPTEICQILMVRHIQRYQDDPKAWERGQ